MPAEAMAGIILAGGLGRRMGGGGEKPFLPLAGRPLLDHVIAHIRPQVAALALNGGDVRLAAYGLPVLADPLPGHLGPLAGVLAGLDWVAALGFSWLLSVPADAPLLPADLAARLSQSLSGAEIAVAESNGRTHPVVALWPVRLAADLRAALIDEDMRAIGRWQARYRLAVVSWSGDPDPFLNINTPQDLAVAAARIG